MFFFDSNNLNNNDLFCTNSMNIISENFCTEESLVINILKNDEILKDFENAKNGFLVYMKPTCPYCIKAIGVMNENSFHLNAINVNDQMEKFSFIKEKLNVRTVPQIFDVRDPKNIKYIGGCDKFLEFMKK